MTEGALTAARDRHKIVLEELGVQKRPLFVLDVPAEVSHEPTDRSCHVARRRGDNFIEGLPKYPVLTGMLGEHLLDADRSPCIDSPQERLEDRLFLGVVVMERSVELGKLPPHLIPRRLSCDEARRHFFRSVDDPAQLFVLREKTCSCFARVHGFLAAAIHGAFYFACCCEQATNA